MRHRSFQNMKFISEASTGVKIQKMKERVRWRHSSITARGIDQTSMVLDNGKDNPDFSFMVIGDSGTKPYPGFHPQRKVAEMMLPHREECSFVLHTGDVIYVVGSQEYYPRNFIEPYREFIQGGENYKRIAYNRITFNETPILPVLGNHDYYDVPLMSRLVAGSTKLLRQFFRYKDIEIGWHGSEQGNAFAQAFIDCLGNIDSSLLAEHLDTHYTAKTDTGLCLRYEPGIFTRIPNRYYTFRYGGIDFFALDSDTFNMPSPIPSTKQGDEKRRQLSKQRHDIEAEEIQILDDITKLNAENSDHVQQLDELNAKLNQIDEVKIDIEKQLTSSSRSNLIDWEQLDWLKKRLIESWHSDEVRGRIIFFHHPPYVTEATKWHQAQTLAVRHRLREVFDAVAQTLGSQNSERPIVDLILNGHAHCLEHLRTTNTGHADSNINCIVSGGSGHRPRRQRKEGNELVEKFMTPNGIDNRKVADSYLFSGRNGDNEMRRLPYSFVRIDVKAGNPPKFTARPFVAEWYQDKWSNITLEPFEF